ncbi:MAG: orotidine-5'-phosphate decarboxylase [Ignavibacteriae bacterium]|nr:orotidine-5'-phosphate decarboxylase [Ignavibacteriota bacterium]
MTISGKLTSIQQKNQSRLCIGLDTELTKLPYILKSKPESIFEFNKAIIEATVNQVCAYKINFAFYEQYGAEGMVALRKSLECIPENIITIADAKRGDIGNTSRAYAASVFEEMNFDAITVSPYMGRDSIEPFLEYDNKIVFILALTSNPGSADFQRLISNGKPIYRHVVETAHTWKCNAALGFVVGATHPNEVQEIRTYSSNSIFLIPGIGTQGGDASATMKANGDAPAIVNVSRAILYASSGVDFESKACEQAQRYQKEIGM